MNECVAPRFLFPLAVTGGVAEGKSTVLSYLVEAGVRCVSADDLAREVWGEPLVIQRIVSLVGTDLALDRHKLLNAMSADGSLRRSVNSVLHPMVLSRMVGSGAQAFEVPLLVETCLQGLFRSVWVVTCGAEEQRKRLCERLGDERSADSLLRSQLNTEVKVVFADHIVRTNRAPFDVHTEVVSLARAMRLS